MPKTFGSLRRQTGRQVAPQALRTPHRQRGYDSKWDRLSLKIRKAAGICQRCKPMGRVRSPKVTDHKHPVSDGGAMYDEGNLWALCRPCHDWKATLEGYARRTGQVDKLRFWCDNPDELPKNFREIDPDKRSAE